MLYNIKNKLVGVNHGVGILEIMELAINLELRNKKKVKVVEDGWIFSKEETQGQKGQGKEVTLVGNRIEETEK